MGRRASSTHCPARASTPWVVLHGLPSSPSPLSPAPSPNPSPAPSPRGLERPESVRLRRHCPPLASEAGPHPLGPAPSLAGQSWALSWARQNGAVAGRCPDVRCLRLRPSTVLHPSGLVVEGGLRLVFLKVGFGEGQPAVTPAVGRESGLPGLLFPGARGVGPVGNGPGNRRVSGERRGRSSGGS